MPAKITQLTLSLVFFFSFVCAAQPAHAETLVVFDASKSMLEQFDGQSRLSAAKAAVFDFLSSANQNDEIGLRMYAHKSHVGNEAAACRETALVQGFTTNHDLVARQVGVAEAVGSYTPTAYALQQTKNDFTSGEENNLILLTDGKETCGGDPVQVARELCQAGIAVKTYVIGLGVDATTRDQLQSIANAGCGKYFDANNVATLNASFQSITEEVAIDRTKDTVGQAVRGGRQASEALVLESGVYHLDHHQKEDEYDYFYLALTPGDEYYVSVGLSDYGIEYDKASNRFLNERIADDWIEHSAEGELTFLSVVENVESQIAGIKASTYDDDTLDYVTIKYNADKTITVTSESNIAKNQKGKTFTPNPLVGSFDKLYFKVGNDNSEMHKLVPITIKKLNTTPSTVQNTSQSELGAVNDAPDYEVVNPSADEIYSDFDKKYPDLAKSNESQRIPVWIWLLVLGVLALIMIIAITLLILKRKNESQQLNFTDGGQMVDTNNVSSQSAGRDQNT